MSQDKVCFVGREPLKSHLAASRCHIIYSWKRPNDPTRLNVCDLAFTSIVSPRYPCLTSAFDFNPPPTAPTLCQLLPTPNPLDTLNNDDQHERTPSSVYACELETATMQVFV